MVGGPLLELKKLTSCPCSHLGRWAGYTLGTLRVFTDVGLFAMLESLHSNGQADWNIQSMAL